MCNIIYAGGEEITQFETISTQKVRQFLVFKVIFAFSRNGFVLAFNCLPNIFFFDSLKQDNLYTKSMQ